LNSTLTQSVFALSWRLM